MRSSAAVLEFEPLRQLVGRYVASAEAQHHATLANRYTPELHAFDRYGQRVDQVDYHPSYHVLMNRAISGDALSRSLSEYAGQEPSA